MTLDVRWEVTCDGSAISHRLGGQVPGGWAAVIEHASDGWSVVGSVAGTTSTRMELTAALMGLREVPDGEPVTVVSDCSIVWAVHDRWEQAILPGPRQRDLPRDIDLWLALAVEFDRLGVCVVRDVSRKEMDPIHRRCHVMAQAQARKLAQECGYTFKHPSREEQERRAAARAERRRLREQQERHRLARRPQPGFRKVEEALLAARVPQAYLADMPHHKHCRAGECVSECIHRSAAA